MIDMKPYLEGKTFRFDEMEIDGESYFRLQILGIRCDIYLTPEEKDEMFYLIRLQNEPVQE